ncbi:MAG: Lar family restriction alleviation protein [Lachnospira eligens]
MIELQDCPRCLGPSLLEEVDHGFYATCLDCGCQSATFRYNNDEDSLKLRRKQLSYGIWQGNLYRLWRLIIYVCIVLKHDRYVCVQCYYN